MKKAFILALFTLSIPCYAQTDQELTRSTVDQATIKGHIYFLASDELKGRETGKPGADIAAQYLATSLMRYGVDPVPNAEKGYFQKIALTNKMPPSEAELTIGPDKIKEIIAFESAEISINEQALYINYGLAEDYEEGVDYQGKVLVATGGNGDAAGLGPIVGLSNKKQGLAIKHGAKALIELQNIEDKNWGRIKTYFEHPSMKLSSGNTGFVHIWANTENTVSKGVPVKLLLSGGKNEPVFSYNVVGMVEGTDPKLKNEYIIYSAHYDHVGIGQPNAENDSIYNGARDNAVGTVTVLSAAENIAKHPTKRSALFILFTGEEKGLLGSKYYVEHPLIPLKQMVYCFNSDNASYNDTSVATIVGLDRTTAESHIKDAATAFGLTAINDPAPEQGLFDRSDNVQFAAKGIPAPTFSLGFTAFDEEVFKYYHQPSDNPDNLDYNYLLKFFSAYVLACRNIANANDTPFWAKGDKYYRAGVALYGK